MLYLYVSVISLLIFFYVAEPGASLHILEILHSLLQLRPCQQDVTPIRYLASERSGEGGGAEASYSELVQDSREELSGAHHLFPPWRRGQEVAEESRCQAGDLLYGHC